ncbi:UxaA family hydrolase [Paenibacillus sp. S3N08]|uniref:UxaA family hydrolase n=1 Tax=Paenibacillus agricola TaxID=2716264 RepID=A0ABX0J567_9BACL|nr:UxaA family hydrolase [Paenibacillus agricola]
MHFFDYFEFVEYIRIKVVPVIKIATRTSTFSIKCVRDNIDMNAGTIIDGTF